MGILKEPAAFVKALRLPAGFSVCELGDQMVSGKTPSQAEAFYRQIGCGRYVAIDGNGRGTVTADLNLPVTGLGAFDLVTDFGTGEHVFDQAQVWKTIHELTIPGGHIVFDRPSQGYGDHCFYLITKGLLVDLAAANGYGVQRLETMSTPRGALIRGVFRLPLTVRPFRVPQQGRYESDLKFTGAA